MRLKSIGFRLAALISVLVVVGIMVVEIKRPRPLKNSVEQAPPAEDPSPESLKASMYRDAEPIAHASDGQKLSDTPDGRFKGLSLRCFSEFAEAEKLQRLTSDPAMQLVSLTGSGFKDEHFRIVAKSPGLRTCSLFDVRLNTASLDPFAGNKRIEWFCLGSNQLFKRHFEVLASMPKLREVWIGYVRCDPGAIEWFRETRPDVNVVLPSY